MPVYLGDSVQWGQRVDLFSSETLNVDTDDGAQRFADQLRFPQALLDDADRFDQLVAELADAAATREPGSAWQLITPIARRHGLSGPDLDMVMKTYETMRRLHDEGRVHIWGYYVRNLGTPGMAFSAGDGVKALVGNPPWLADRFMTKAMQARFKEMSETRGLWAGGSVAAQQDLSDLFVTRTVERFSPALMEHLASSCLPPCSHVLSTQAFGVEAGPSMAARLPSPSGPRGTFQWADPYLSDVRRGPWTPELPTMLPLGPEVEKWRGSIRNVGAPWTVSFP